ncbi:Putative peptide zinc metalloprotease protein YydH [Rosistilla carotiformis]|uniref:Peptide zinc metalloprotease protein YydH n=1 Tax=Rosistilla carotiformis TaxID=2528017 RepID=A0A518JXK4_9BACT|nr:efflux RND transporter periplasmic adaptor subunit [Rosistilla carotiformis]QDV70269.1 Putative peptide zinc metalloprotease protein YydH [Rosistilla carotiformis]
MTPPIDVADAPQRPADSRSDRSTTGDAPRVRMRSDLHATATYHQGRRYWLIRDPLARQVVRLSETDYQQLQQIEDADPGLIAEAAEQQLLQGVRPSRRGHSESRFNPFYIRLPGVDPEGLLGWLVPRTRWLFGIRAVLFWGVIMALAMAMVLTHSRQFVQALPSFHTFFGPQNWLSLAVTILATKVLHELAHGIVCRRFGARCPEIGVLLLCGTPCMYCDVTDTWSLPSRWQRAAVMLAGVYVEAILAAVATLIWWFARVGPVYFTCMNLMFVCGVSTLVFNMNPLMRFDGYYVLSDLVNVPNLRSQAAVAWRSVVLAPLGGDAFRNASPRRPRGARWLVLFHAASTAWRWMAVVAIAYWVIAVADTARLLPFGYLAACGLIAAAVMPMFRKGIGLASGDDAWKGVHRMRRAILVTAFAAGLLAILFVPLPRRLSATGIVDYSDATTLYVRSEGRVDRVQVEFGQPVEAGQTIIQLESPSLRKEQMELVSQNAEARLRVVSLRRRALSNPDLMEQWDSQQATAESLQQRVAYLDRQVQQLAIQSTAAGVVLPMIDPDRAARISLDELTGQHLTEGTKLCRIGDPLRREVVLELDADARSAIEPGSRVRVRFDQNGVGVVVTRVDAISEIRRGGDALATGEVEKFRVVCKLPNTTTALAGTQVRAKVTASPQPLIHRIVRAWRETF